MTVSILDGAAGVQVRALRALEGSWHGEAANADRARAYRNTRSQPFRMARTRS